MGRQRIEPGSVWSRKRRGALVIVESVQGSRVMWRAVGRPRRPGARHQGRPAMTSFLAAYEDTGLRVGRSTLEEQIS